MVRFREGSPTRPLWIVLPGYLVCDTVESMLASVASRVKDARETPSGQRLAEAHKAVGLDMQPVDQPVCTIESLVELAHQAFQDALDACIKAAKDQGLSVEDGTLDLAGLDRDRPFLTALGWLYGPQSSMVAHHDTPTFPGSKDEWLVSFNAGLTMNFEADGEPLPLASGDVVVMDTLAVKHGVLGILPGTAPAECSLQDARLGLLLWSSYNPDPKARATLAADEGAAAEGLSNLFPDSSDDDDDDDEGNNNDE